MLGLVGHRNVQRIVCAVVALAFALGSLGILPSGRTLQRWTGTIAGERYPCEDHACGCASAEECWTNCCCFEPEDRLAWAIAHGVRPPRGVEFSDEQWLAAMRRVKPGSGKCALCVTGVKEKLAKGLRTEPECSTVGGACGGESCCSDGHPLKDRTPAPIGGAMNALSCKGLEWVLTTCLPVTLGGTDAADLWAVVSVPQTAARPVWPETLGASERALEVPAPPPKC